MRYIHQDENRNGIGATTTKTKIKWMKFVVNRNRATRKRKKKTFSIAIRNEETTTKQNSISKISNAEWFRIEKKQTTFTQ